MGWRSSVCRLIRKDAGHHLDENRAVDIFKKLKKAVLPKLAKPLYYWLIRIPVQPQQHQVLLLEVRVQFQL